MSGIGDARRVLATLVVAVGGNVAVPGRGGRDDLGRRGAMGDLDITDGVTASSGPVDRAFPGGGLLPQRTTSRSATRLDGVNEVHRHDLGGRKLPIEPSSNLVATASAWL
jgi:hypothetical protein